VYAITQKTRFSVRRLAATAALAAMLSGIAGLAQAGQCPADKIGTNVTAPGATMAKDVSDDVLASIRLAEHFQALPDRQLRLRQLEIKPGGVVPWHSHADRPALIYILEGSITEYSSNCAVPIEHKAGEVAPESVGLSHWWRNNGNVVVRLIAADIAQAQ